MRIGKGGLLIGGVAALVNAAANIANKGLSTADACNSRCQFVPELPNTVSTL
jgi:hypothetical protein